VVCVQVNGAWKYELSRHIEDTSRFSGFASRREARDVFLFGVEIGVDQIAADEHATARKTQIKFSHRTFLAPRFPKKTFSRRQGAEYAK
jgi:hypothetical protein